jgi:hypothetical protein
MHDGGKNVLISLNSDVICDSQALYEAKSVTTGSSHDGHMGESMSGMTQCEKVLPLKKGDRIAVKATFNSTAHPM